MSKASMAVPQAPDLSRWREHFPSLARAVEDRPVVYLDNPGGTQVPRECTDAIVEYLTTSNANTHGAFATSRHTDDVLAAAHAGMAAMLNAADPAEVYFGPNMTTLTFALSRAIGRTLRPGDEIVVTALDHDANVAPWLALQEERDIHVRMSNIHVDSCTLDMDDLRGKINERTRVVAVGYASNAVGTINDVATITRWAHAAGALAFVDAVHMAPHAPIDVQALGCDFLVCSPYKFFGPHLGVMYGRLDLLQSLPAYKVRPASDLAPERWETGTQLHEGIAGLVGTLSYLASLGRAHGDPYILEFAAMDGMRRDLHVAFAAIQAYERQLAWRMLDGLAQMPGVRVYGLISRDELSHRVPTVAITIVGHTPRELAVKLAARGVFAWDGNYYAVNLMERLGLEPAGGALRLGLAHYNTANEVDITLDELRALVRA